jgi:hypothetical protein
MSPRGTGEPAHYSEDHCALRPPLVFNGLFWPLLVVASFICLLVTNSSGFMLGVVVGIVGSLALGGLALGQGWPIGIRVGTAGVRIGGIRRSERLAARQRQEPRQIPRARTQRRQVFSCPWEAVQRIEVVTDRREIRRYAKLGRNVGGTRLEAATRTMRLGLLTSPYMRALLVINVDLAAPGIHIPEFRPPDTQRYWFKPSAPQRFAPHPVWVAPTRHPEQLRTALAELGVPGLVDR